MAHGFPSSFHSYDVRMATARDSARPIAGMIDKPLGGRVAKI